MHTFPYRKMSKSAVTVVTAYYPIPSKFEPQTYLTWIQQFWPSAAACVVFFTVPNMVRGLERLLEKKINGGTAKVVGLPLEEFDAYRRINPLLWKMAEEKDPEEGVLHSAELYAVWFEKKEFVRRAIELNPFGSERFVWCDAGILRNPRWAPAVCEMFPLDAHIPRGRMLVLEIDPFKDADYVRGADGIYGVGFEKRSTVGGGILASDVEGWRRWGAAYDRMFMKYVLAGRFFGKDQNIMASMILEDPGLAVRIRGPPFLPGVDAWFYLLLFLSGVAVRQG